MEDIDKEILNKLGGHSEEPPAALFESAMFQREKELRQFRTKRLLLITGGTILIVIMAYVLYKSVLTATNDSDSSQLMTTAPLPDVSSENDARLLINMATEWPDYRATLPANIVGLYHSGLHHNTTWPSTQVTVSEPREQVHRTSAVKTSGKLGIAQPKTGESHQPQHYQPSKPLPTSKSGGVPRAFFSYRITSRGEVTFINESEAEDQAHYTWHFGDGNTSESTNAQYSFSKNGIYHTCLSVADKRGRYDSYCTDLYIENLPETRDIRGEVNLKNSIPDKAWVYLIRFDSVKMTPFLIDSARTDETGHFIFHGKSEGYYILRGALDSKSKHYNQYLPTFYGQTLGWNLATRYAINSEMPSYSNIHIDLIHLNDLGAGSGTITGASTSENELLVLYDEKGNPVGFTYSDGSGGFAFHDLPPGKYRVYNPATGKFSSYTSYGPPAPIEQPAHPSSEGSSDRKSDTGTGGNLGLTTSDFTLTPNPCRTYTTVKFDNPDLCRARVSVININTNTEVFAFTVKNPQLKQEVNIDVQYWAPGIYFVTIDKGNGNVMTSKLLKTE